MNSDAEISENLVLSMRAYRSCRGFISATRVVDVLVHDIHMIDNEYQLCVLGKLLRKWNYLVEIHRAQIPSQAIPERLPGRLIDIGFGSNSAAGFAAKINNDQISNKKEVVRVISSS